MKMLHLGSALAALATMAPGAMSGPIMNMADTDVAKKGETGVSSLNFGSDVGKGTEGADKDSFAIPFLRVLQSNSPQVNEARGEYIKDAKAGMLFNTATRELFDGKEGVVILPCAFQRRFIQWAPRGSDGGFEGEHTQEEVAKLEEAGLAVELERRLYVVEKPGETPHEKKNDRLQDTRSHFVIVETADGFGQALLALSGTQIKKSKQLMSMISSVKVETPDGKVTPPTWMNRVRVTTVAESNDEGDWFGVQFVAEGLIDRQDLYDAGRDFNETVAEGKAKVDHNAAKDDASGSTTQGGKF